MGAIPAWGGTQALPRHVGMARARQMLLTGRPLASELLVMGGLIAAVVPDRDSALAEALSYVASAATTSRPAFASIKELVRLSGVLSAAAGGVAELAADRALAFEFAARAQDAFGR
jgi:enoyl-CoA hydratase